MTILAVAVLALAGCGGPRPIERNPGPQAFPPSLFTDNLPGPEIIGIAGSRLETLRKNLGQEESSRPDRSGVIEYFSNHPYVLAVHYEISVDDNRLVRMEYELNPAVKSDIGLWLALLNEMVAAYGMPIETPTGFVWDYQQWRLRWAGIGISIERRPSIGS